MFLRISWAGASEDRVTARCKFQHRTFCRAVPMCLPVCKRESHTTFSHLQGREMSASLQENLWHVRILMMNFVCTSSMFFWVKSKSLCIDIKMMRPLKSRGCTLLASFIVVWTTWSSCIVVCPGNLFHSNTDRLSSYITKFTIFLICDEIFRSPVFPCVG